MSGWKDFTADRQTRRTLQILGRYLLAITLVVVLFTQIFHALMAYEGRAYSWLTGLYWTLSTMTTLGYGDIVFQSEAGRIFSVVVVSTGILLLFLILPFVFVRMGPWLEVRLRMTAPTQVPSGTRGHVILCHHDVITSGLIERLEQEGIPYFLIDEDPVRASDRYARGLSVVQGEVDRKETYQALRVAQARLVFANRSDMDNTNIVLTVHEVAPEVPVAALAAFEHSIDVLELSGVRHVLPLKRWLGEQLANRVSALHTEVHPIGRYENLLFAEVPLHRTPLAGKTIRETGLRQHTGVSIVGVWERGRLYPARPDYRLSDTSVMVVIGTEDQLEHLNTLLAIYDFNPNPVLVIGGGTVGRAVIRSLSHKNIPVHVIDLKPDVCSRLEGMCQAVFTGNAADYQLIEEAGIGEAPSVVLTTNDDAMNVYLASYCRHLNPEVRIISRVTHERNIEALHRAGADFVLSYHALGVDALMAILKNHELVVLGERVDLFSVPVPPALQEKTLAESGIGARTGLSVIALRREGKTITDLKPSTILPADGELVMIGDIEQWKRFDELFGRETSGAEGGARAGQKAKEVRS
ncbi:MAG: potassium transporter TrkA [Rhodothermaceae bacterium]|nr:MAG: potassium transporter TrkA [Rhodothermaceae bacterium]